MEATTAPTFKSLVGSGAFVLVGMKLQSELLVSLLYVAVRGIFGDAQYFVVILTFLHPANVKE